MIKVTKTGGEWLYLNTKKVSMANRANAMRKILKTFHLKLKTRQE